MPRFVLVLYYRLVTIFVAIYAQKNKEILKIFEWGIVI